MEPKLEFELTVTDAGRIEWPASALEQVANAFVGKKVVATFERKRKKRSQNQNAYYWAVVVPTITQALNDSGEMLNDATVHEFLKYRNLKQILVNRDTGEELGVYGASTTGLTVFQFSLYLDDCIQFAQQQLNTTIPPPSLFRDAYQFEELPFPGESRADYLDRIALIISHIRTLPELLRYFKLTPEWKDDAEVKVVFSKRKSEI